MAPLKNTMQPSYYAILFFLKICVTSINNEIMNCKIA